MNGIFSLSQHSIRGHDRQMDLRRGERSRASLPFFGVFGMPNIPPDWRPQRPAHSGWMFARTAMACIRGSSVSSWAKAFVEPTKPLRTAGYAGRDSAAGARLRCRHRRHVQYGVGVPDQRRTAPPPPIRATFGGVGVGVGGGRSEDLRDSRFIEKGNHARAIRLVYRTSSQAERKSSATASKSSKDVSNEGASSS